MARKNYPGSPLLYDDVTNDIVGLKDPDSSEFYFGRAKGSFYDTTTQTASANTATVITYNSTSISRGISIVSGSRIKVADPGDYNVQFSMQLENSDTQSHDVTVWFRVNGVDIPDSGTEIGVPGTHGGINGHNVAAWNLYTTLVAGDYFELVWSTASTTVTLPTIAARTGPVRPRTPSMILTINQLPS